MTTIRYFLPEDGDTEAYPNVFLAPKSRNQGSPPTLGQVRDAFPLPGKYHFRFKSALVPSDSKGMAVWMDCASDNMPVSTYKNTIVCKVTRISMEDEEDSDDEFERHRAPAPTPSHSTPAPQPRRAPPQPAAATPVAAPAEPLLDVFETTTTQPAHHSRHGSNASSSNQPGNLLDVPVAPAPTSGGSLLDMDTPVTTTASTSNAHADFLGMTAPTAHVNSSYQPQQQQQQPTNGYPTAATPQQQQNGGYRPKPTPQQQQQQNVPRAPNSGNAFDSYNNTQGPFGGLAWK